MVSYTEHRVSTAYLGDLVGGYYCVTCKDFTAVSRPIITLSVAGVSKDIGSFRCCPACAERNSE